MKTMTFDERCAYWSPNEETNRYWLDRNIDYIQETLLGRGYIYLNQVYEALGIHWNPDNENICYKAVNGRLRTKITDGLGDVLFIDIDQ